MNLYQKRSILLGVLALWLLLTALCGYFFQKETATWISVLLFCGWFYLYLKWWQCPHCLRSLGRLQLADITCPCCGKKIPRK